MALDCGVQCQICAIRQQANFSHCVQKGWPQHCGYTMRLETRIPEEKVRAAFDAEFLPRKLRAWLMRDIEEDL